VSINPLFNANAYKNDMNQLRSVRRLLIGLASGLTLCGIGAIMSPEAGWSAEKVTMKYGPFYRSIAVADLAEYAASGKPSAELDSFLNLIKDKDRESLTKTLNMKFPFGVVQVDKLLKTPMAEGLLKEVSSATILPGDTEVVALRGALLIAASTKEGLGTLSLLKSYPTPTLTVDLQRLLELMKNSKSFKGLGAMMGSFGGSMPSGGAAAPAPSSPSSEPAPSGGAAPAPSSEPAPSGGAAPAPSSEPAPSSDWAPK
jgi:hypothetical protein